MKRAIVLVVLLFAITLLVRLPASVLLPLLPAQVQCIGAGGTLWSGFCGELRTQGATLTDVRWRLQPWSLLRLRPQLDVESGDPRLSGRGHIEIAPSGEIDLTALSLVLALSSAPPPLPAGWDGAVEAQFDQVRVHGQQVLALKGRILARQLRQLDPAMSFGDFELVFPGTENAPPMRGRLRDRGGPLAVDATVTVSSAGAYDVAGTVAARPGADPQLVQVLELFGNADAQGRRPFSLAGSL